MSQFPTYNETLSAINAELISNFPDINITDTTNQIEGLARAFASAASNFSVVGRQLLQQYFIQFAQGEFLADRATESGITRLDLTPASGNVILTGSGTVPIGTVFAANNGILYTSTAQVVGQTVNLSVDTMSYLTDTVTATFVNPHGYATGQTVTITGADQFEYNGNFVVRVTDEFTIQYTPNDTPTVTPATGTILATTTNAIVPVTANNGGNDTNQTDGAILTPQTTIAGFADTGLAQFPGFEGGQDNEADNSLRERTQSFLSSKNSPFTNEKIRSAGLTIPGNTDIFIDNPDSSVANPGTDAPLPGQVWVYPYRGNDSNPIPSQTILDQTKQAILTQAGLPAQTWAGDVLVLALTLQAVDFDFASLTPNTTELQNAVTAQLQAYFQDQVVFGQDIPLNALIATIWDTIAPTTGDRLTNFVLTTPNADITIANGAIGSLGNITYPAVG